ncbi:DNA-directed RNA polymerase I subunit RPA12 [Periplaneta americana]|uniref:DNA-directed RNA polymerase I subunit RPA12 n=1 Tax=Periplaneta americana TaxID=6978 RepID=UPI0037E8203D
MESIVNEPGFCPKCGTILPVLGARSSVNCYNCKQNFGAEVFSGLEFHYVIQFNYPDMYDGSLKKNESSLEGPVLERRCPKCNNDKMSYTTLQLRSADEGQTIFYTCTKCKFKETENS